jgi:uncharacterized protein
MARMVLRFGGLGLTLVLVLWLFPAAAQLVFPELSGRVVDNAQLLSPEDRAALNAELKALEDKSSDQLVVVTLPSLQGYTIEDYGYQLGRHWGIGTAKLNNGVLLIVAPNERKVRIEVGRGLEPTLTDALSSIVINHAILPRFRAGDFAGGIKDGVGDIVRVLTGDAAEVEARARARQDADDPAIDWIVVIIWSVIVLWILYNIWRSIRHTPGASHGRRSVSTSPSWSGGGGSWSSSGSGGGGFSGGGGSFGGGGSSGSW